MSANASSAITVVAGPASSPRSCVERVAVRRRVRMTTSLRRSAAHHPPVRTHTTRASASATSGAGAGGRETLSEGSRGEETYRLQQRLAEEGVLSVEDVTGCVQDAMRKNLSV
jgi:hypothetical protein